MNKQLFQAYKELSDTEQARLRHKYKDSPIGLRLITFLSQSENPNFKTSEAVGFIYKDDKEEYSVLENRYFKLRKKVYDDLQDKPAVDDDRELAEEEAILNRCKHLITIGENKEAYRQLTALEKQCWERNIFELLPSLIDNMIFCNQGMQETEKNEKLFPQLKRAIELQYDMNRAVMLIREIYEISLVKGFKFANVPHAALKELALKNKEYPRFSMCYHYTSASHKLSSMNYAGNMQVISRHLAEFKKIYAQNPMMPLIIYKANYEKLLHFHFNQLNALFYTNKAEFEEAYEAMKEMWESTLHSPIFRRYKIDPMYFNFFVLQYLTGRYKQAFETTNYFSEHLKEGKRLDRIPLVNVLKAMLYISSYPQVFKMDIDYLLEQADEYMKEARKHENVQIPFSQASAIKAKLYLFKGEVEKAKKILVSEEVVKYLEQSKVRDITGQLLKAMKDEKVSRNRQLEEINKIAIQRRMKAVMLDEFVEFNWLINYTGLLLKRS